MCISAGRAAPSASHQRCQGTAPAVISSLREGRAGCGAVAGSPGGDAQPSPRCGGSESHPATCPARRCRAREAAQAGQVRVFPRTGSSLKLSYRHIPSRQHVLAQGRDQERSPAPTPLQQESFCRAVSVPRLLQRAQQGVRKSSPRGVSRQDGLWRMAVLQPSPRWQRRPDDKAAEVAD